MHGASCHATTKRKKSLCSDDACGLATRPMKFAMVLSSKALAILTNGFCKQRFTTWVALAQLILRNFQHPL
jgi:hypothetical protein